MVGDRVPDVLFELLSGAVANPTDFRGQKLVLFFCDGADPVACSRRLREFADLAAEFAQTGTWIVGLVGGPDHRALPQQLPRISVALDQQGEVARAFGLDERSGETKNATFLIDRDGTVDRRWPQPADARDVLEAARELT